VTGVFRDIEAVRADQRVTDLQATDHRDRWRRTTIRRFTPIPVELMQRGERQKSFTMAGIL